MLKDPIVEEVRKVRRQIEAEFPEPQEYLQHLRQIESRHRDRLKRARRAPTVRKKAS
jgi:hypothetical protein